jgi:hypothetical protein
VAGRVLTFADAGLIRVARAEFVPVVGDDWYQRRRQDGEGEFFRRVSDQAGRGDHSTDGGSTRQGIYCLTAAGRLLAFKNCGNSAEETQKLLQRALDAWNKLPATERQAGAVSVREGPLDPRYVRTPPAGTLIASVYTRLLERDAHGKLSIRDTAPDRARGEPQRDHLWIRESEWRALIPVRPEPGDHIPVPEAVQQRLFLFHLVDNTAGEPFAWRFEDLRSGSLSLTVENVAATKIKLRLQGNALLATDADLGRAERGYDARLLGYLTYDRSKHSFVTFNCVVLGACWGQQAIGGFRQRDQRLLGVALEFAGDAPADRIPPQGARWMEGYWRPGR